MSGLTKAAKTKRKHRNFVTMKFNLLSFVLEAASVILVALFRTYLPRLFYLIVNYCGTPLVHYINITTSRIDKELVIVLCVGVPPGY